MMRKKAQVTGLGMAVIVAIMIFMVGIITVNFIKDEVTSARSAATGLDCSNSNISDGTKLTCLVVDWVVPYFIILVFSISGGMIVSQVHSKMTG